MFVAGTYHLVAFFTRICLATTFVVFVKLSLPSYSSTIVTCFVALVIAFLSLLPNLPHQDMINNPPLGKEALEVLEEDDDVMEILRPTNFIPRKRRARKMERLDDIFLRRSKRLLGKLGGFRNEESAKEAIKEVVVEPTSLTIIPATSSSLAPHLTKVVVEGIDKGFVDIHPEGNSGNTVCEVCGHIGYGQLLVCCGDCKGSTTHQYCLEEVVYEARFVEFVCYECHQRNEELKNVSVEKEQDHAYSGSTVHLLGTKPLESAIDAVEWRNTEGRFGKYYSRKKGCKTKPTMQPVSSNLANRNNPGGFTTKLIGEKSLPAHKEGSNPATWK